MNFIRRFIEQKISRATGAEVRLGAFSFSPLSGVVQVRELAVGTFLTVRRIEARIAVGRALKQEIVVRSLAIEGPVVTITRDAAGKFNLPPLPSRQAAAGDEKKSWEFEAQKVLVVEGQASFLDASGYRISLDKVIGSIERKSPNETELVFAADSLGRRDIAVELGEARLLGKVASGISFALTAGSLLDLSVRTAALESGRWEGEMNLAMSLATLLALLPPAVRLPITTASGEARLAVTGGFDRSTSTLNLQTFELRTNVVAVRS
jgi:uncharacterized protein involved in outer membrane biogenesis